MAIGTFVTRDRRGHAASRTRCGFGFGRWSPVAAMVTLCRVRHWPRRPWRARLLSPRRSTGADRATATPSAWRRQPPRPRRSRAPPPSPAPRPDVGHADPLPPPASSSGRETSSATPSARRRPPHPPPRALPTRSRRGRHDGHRSRCDGRVGRPATPRGRDPAGRFLPGDRRTLVSSAGGYQLLLQERRQPRHLQLGRRPGLVDIDRRVGSLVADGAERRQPRAVHGGRCSRSGGRGPPAPARRGCRCRPTGTWCCTTPTGRCGRRGRGSWRTCCCPRS